MALGKPTVSTECNAAVVQALSKVAPQQLHAGAVAHAKTAEPHELDDLVNLLKKVSPGLFRDKNNTINETMHCYRCHADYSVGNNTAKACYVEHYAEETVHHNGAYAATCDKCGEFQEIEYNDGSIEGHCYIRRHCNDEAKVKKEGLAKSCEEASDCEGRNDDEDDEEDDEDEEDEEM